MPVYPQLPWPEDVPRNVMPKPFWLEMWTALLVGHYLGKKMNGEL